MFKPLEFQLGVAISAAGVADGLDKGAIKQISKWWSAQLNSGEVSLVFPLKERML